MTSTNKNFLTMALSLSYAYQTKARNPETRRWSNTGFLAATAGPPRPPP